MKKYFFTLVILISMELSATVSIVSGFLNDNYTGSIENGINGNYIGADDFLTFTLFVKCRNDQFLFSEYYHVITSRKFEYRYDLLDSTFGYDAELFNFILRPSISLLYKSNLGGEVVQNGFHDFRNIPHLVQGYTSSELGGSLGFKGSYRLSSLLIDNDSLKGCVNIDIPSSIKPISASMAMSYLLDFSYFHFDIAGGYKIYLNEVEQYSDFVRSGPLFGIQGVATLFKGISVNAGALFFPVKNLDNDPSYRSKNHCFSPQFWVTLGLNGSCFDIMDMVNI